MIISYFRRALNYETEKSDFRDFFRIFLNNLNPWHYSPEEPRPTEEVATRWQYRGPCG